LGKINDLVFEDLGDNTSLTPNKDYLPVRLNDIIRQIIAQEKYSNIYENKSLHVMLKKGLDPDYKYGTDEIPLIHHFIKNALHDGYSLLLVELLNDYDVDINIKYLHKEPLIKIIDEFDESCTYKESTIINLLGNLYNGKKKLILSDMILKKIKEKQNHNNGKNI
jgi:hypothetical protein